MKNDIKVLFYFARLQLWAWILFHALWPIFVSFVWVWIVHSHIFPVFYHFLILDSWQQFMRSGCQPVPVGRATSASSPSETALPCSEAEGRFTHVGFWFACCHFSHHSLLSHVVWGMDIVLPSSQWLPSCPSTVYLKVHPWRSWDATFMTYYMPICTGFIF